MSSSVSTVIAVESALVLGGVYVSHSLVLG